MHAMPALLAGLTALTTSALVHAGFALWWLSQLLLRGPAPAYDWTGALTVSGAATVAVLIVALLARRLVGGHAPTAPAEAPLQAIPVRAAVRRDR